MSQTPLELGAAASAAEYMQAWQTMHRWTAEGRSWSGRERHCCFLNTGGNWFADVSSVSGLNFADDGRGLALVDWDHDGDLDLWMTSRISPQVRYLRNDAVGHPNFVAFRLHGRSCNRDAIGARVDVTVDRKAAAGAPRVRARTLRAGEGFLSQSSKWLHFGLGEAEEIELVTVLWPDGSQQDFPGLAPNRHYQITQGEPAALPWQRPAPAVELATARTEPAALATSATHWLAARYPLPSLEYHPFAPSEPRLPVADLKGPLLLNLWASWCTPCVDELSSWTAARAELEQAGLQVLALSVDGLEEDGSRPQDSPQTLARIGFPFGAGRATAELVSALQQTHDALLATHEQLPIPCSFLIDESGEMAAIYWGSVAPRQVISDVARLPLSGDALFQSAIPRPGRWEVQPRGIRGVAYFEHAKRAAQRDDLETALAAVQRSIEESPRSLPQRLLASALWKRMGQLNRAAEQLEQVLRLNPNHADALTWLGELRLEQGAFEDAEAAVAELLARDPADPAALQQSGKLLVRKGDLKAALGQFQRALERAPDNASLHGDLAVALHRLGRYREAFVEYKASLQRDARQIRIAAEFAWLLATCEEATIRNGTVALQIARQCVAGADGSGSRDPSLLDKLAAALAETGQFEEAAATARRALALAQSQQQQQLADAVQDRIRLYEAGEPFREGVSRAGHP